MARQTLFHILLRQPWWLSAVAGAILFAIARAIFPPVAPFIALPFLLLAAYVGFLQLRGTAEVNVGDRLAALRDLSWEEFSAMIREAYRRQGYAVSDVRDAACELELAKDGRRTLVSCRRWKANSVGIGPLRALVEAVERREAYNAVCIGAGEFSANAREYAATQPLKLVGGAELVKLVRGLRPSPARKSSS